MLDAFKTCGSSPPAMVLLILALFVAGCAPAQKPTIDPLCDRDGVCQDGPRHGDGSPAGEGGTGE